MSPDLFAKIMQEIKNQYEDDEEMVHKHMDALLCETLTELGYDEGIEIYNSTPFWYA